MAIPEHSKCVKAHKQIRYNLRRGKWRDFRSIRRKNGEIKLKMRIRTMLNIQFAMEKSRISKEYEMKYWKAKVALFGPYYRKWGKYND